METSAIFFIAVKNHTITQNEFHNGGESDRFSFKFNYRYISLYVNWKIPDYSRGLVFNWQADSDFPMTSTIANVSLQYSF